MARFRNVLVHGYQDVDLNIVRDILEHRLHDPLACCRTAGDGL